MSKFDPAAVLAALERQRAAYVLIGDLAGVLHGSDLLARTVEITPSLKPENIERLEQALTDLAVEKPERVRDLADGKRLVITTPAGTLDLNPLPDGSTGYNDLRRGAERQPLGQGLRPLVASPPDLVRTLSPDAEPLLIPRLRRIMELDRSLAPEM